MTKVELEKWIRENSKNGNGFKIIDGSYEFIEVDDDWKLIVEGNINLIEMGLTELPNIFHSVSGVFDCSENQLTSLNHCPDTVKKLDCSGNQLTSLEYIPDSVEGLYCSENQLTSLEHCPNSVKYLNCSYNQITSLEHCPDSIEYLDCSENKLTSLEHCPDSVKTLDCNDNKITSLEYCPLSLEEFYSDFSSEDYELYVQTEKDKLEREESNERVDEIEQLMELNR